jgi:peptide/nickel transport system substrate-binding protein
MKERRRATHTAYRRRFSVRSRWADAAHHDQKEQRMNEISVTRRRLLTTTTAALGGAVLTGPATSLVAAAQSATPETGPAPGSGPLGGQVKFAYATPATLNPLFSTAGVDQGVSRQVYGALVAMTDAPDVEMDLAESVDISEDATTYTFHLRDGLKFPDGTPLTSKDVLFTFTRAIDPRTGSFWRSRFLAIDGAEAYDGVTVTDIPGLQAPDDKTVTMKLSAPDVTWLITLGDFAGFSILPEHAFGSIPPDQLQKAPFSFAPGPGAGAFTFGEYLADQYVSLNRNDAYQPPKANIDQLYLPILPQTVTALSQLQNGELDIAQVLIPDMASVQGNPDLTVSSEPSVMMQFMVPNLTRPEFADKRVRQAMIYALDRASIVKEIMLDQVTVINSCFFGWQWENVEPEGLNTYPYDPDKARQLLQEANWDSNTKVVSHYIPGNQLEESLLNIFVQQYKDVGINVELQAVDVPDYTNRIVSGAKDGQTGDFQLMLGSGGVMGQDPNITVKYITTNAATPTGSNYNHFSNAQVDELMIQGRATKDVEERKRIYTEVAKIVNDEAVWIFLWRLNSIYGVNKRVQGFKAPGHPGRVISSAHKWSVVQQ